MRSHRPAVPTGPGGTSSRASVAIIGGGIGGLSAALSLLQAGVDVQVYEQAPMLGEVGAGLQVSPNAARVLHRLGLAGELARTGVPPLAWHQRRWDDGRTLLRTPLAGRLEAAFGFPQYQIHRADLLAALANALPTDRVHLGHQLTDLADRGDHIQATFANGAHAEVEVLVAPTASTRPSATCCSAPRIRTSPAVSPTAGWSRPTGWPTPKPPSPAGTPRSAPSSPPPTMPSSPPCSTAHRCSAGRWAE